jgi:ABC-type anion transport system duplicated permease subunit
MAVLEEDGSALMVREARGGLAMVDQTATRTPPVPAMARVKATAAMGVSDNSMEETLADNGAAASMLVVLLQTLKMRSVKRKRPKDALKKNEPKNSRLRKSVLGRNVLRQSMLLKKPVPKKKLSAKRNCAARWMSSSANATQRPRRRRRSASAKP